MAIKTKTDIGRTLKPRTCKIYIDQIEYLTKLAAKLNTSVDYLIRKGLDEMYKLPKEVKNDTTKSVKAS